MNRLLYAFYEGKVFKRILSLTGRVPAGYYVGWGNWMTLEEAQSCVGPGWAGLVKIGFDQCLATGTRITQIKEKYGGLRFYADGIEIETDDIEAQSYLVCEECGGPGTLRPTGWWKTLCDSCAGSDERLRRRDLYWQWRGGTQ